MPYKTDATAGDEASSTYEGRHIYVLESLLTHVDPGDGLVDKGQPVVCTDLVGVALNSAQVATDYIAIDTEGIWYLSVVGAGTVAVGQHLFITNAAIVTDANLGTSRNFGYALGAIASPGTAVIAVKVHFEAPVVPAG